MPAASDALRYLNDRIAYIAASRSGFLYCAPTITRRDADETCPACARRCDARAAAERGCRDPARGCRQPARRRRQQLQLGTRRAAGYAVRERFAVQVLRAPHVVPEPARLLR